MSIKVLTLNIRGLKSKIEKVKNLILKQKPDFLCLQETNIDKTEEGNRMKFLLGLEEGVFGLNKNSNGTAILKTSDKYKIIKRSTAAAGRITCLKIARGQEKYNIINIYSPTECKNQMIDQFYKDLEIFVGNNKENEIIITGDFNCVLNKLDIKSTIYHIKTNRTNPNHKHLKTLREIMRYNNLKDAYRNLYPRGNDVTQKCPLGNPARLDKFLIQKEVESFEIKILEKTLKFTDHKGVILNIGPREQEKKKRNGVWKFNNSLLEDKDFVDRTNKVIEEYTEFATEETSGEMWDLMKRCIKEIAIRKGIELAKERKHKITKLQEEIEEIREKGTEMEKLREYEEELQDLVNYKCRGAKIRSRFLDKAEETPNKRFLTIESWIQKDRCIHEVENMEGITVKANEEIANAFGKFYEELFRDEGTDENEQENILKHCKHLEDEETTTLEGPFTDKEILKSVKELNTNKSPGPDGLTSEFYKHFITKLGPLFKEMTKQSFNKKMLPDSLNESLITLIPKDEDDRTNMKKYRPISLLNTDYKIITKILTNRLKPHMDKLVHRDQQCAVANRNISNHTHFVRDYINFSSHKQSQTALLSLDQEKAFDRVSHTYLLKTLTKCKLGETFITWIKTIYNNPCSSVTVNHTQSQKFRLTRSVRQGCSLSPLLYVLTLEPLLEKIRQSTNIAPALVPGNTQKKLIAYADDTTFLIQKEQDLTLILEEFQKYGKASGAKININKSMIMGLGKWKNKTEWGVDVKNTKEMKIYGINFHSDPRKVDEQMWQKLLEKTRKKVEHIYYKSASLFGRVVLINTLIIPKFLYQTEIYDPPAHIFKTLNGILRNFIFQGMPGRVKQNTIVQHKLKGGLGLQDLKLKVKTQRMVFIKNIISKPERYPLAYYFLALTLKKQIPFHNFTPHFIGPLPKYHRNLKETYKGYESQMNQMTSKEIYKRLLEKIHTKYMDIQWSKIFLTLDHDQTFLNIHKNYNTPKIKEIAYRLVYNITPTKEGMAKKRNHIFECKICRNNMQETEKHIFLQCPMTAPARLMLKDVLLRRSGCRQEDLDINKVITLHRLPDSATENVDACIKLLGTFKQIVWNVRNFSVKKDYKYNKTDILQNLLDKIIDIFPDYMEDF